jgi:hypothetical protein
VLQADLFRLKAEDRHAKKPKKGTFVLGLVIGGAGQRTMSLLDLFSE